MDDTRFDWDAAGPSPEALIAFSAVVDEKEFPDTYSGQAWRAAYRIWKVCKATPEKLNVGPFDPIEGLDISGLGLSGFMYGWAFNAVRQMLGKPAGPNPAILTFGVKDQPPYPSIGPAGKAMRRAMGGDEEA